jgi:hypothetical protein
VTPDGPDPLRVFQTLALVLFAILMIIAFLRMSWRLSLFRTARERTPLLLKRDILLFGTFALYFGFVLVFRVMGLTITQNPFWVVPSTLLGLAALSYWVWVEFHID